MAEWVFKPNPRRPGSGLTWFQSWIFEQQVRNVVAVAARRSGKTVGVRARMLRRAIETPHALVGYCAPTLKQAKRIIWRSLLNDLRDPAARSFVDSRAINRSDLTIDFKNDSRIALFGAENAESLRGLGFDELIVDEADDPNYDDAFFHEIVGPALSDNLGTLVQIGSPKGRGRLYHEFIKGDGASPLEQRDADYAAIQVTAIEAGILDRREIEKARRTRPRRAFAQEYEAHFNAPIGVIYDEWNKARHVVSKVPERFEQVIVGVDWGSANRGTMLVLGIDSVYLPETDDYEGAHLGRVWVLHEESHAGTGYDTEGWWRLARLIRDRYRPSRWYADPAGGQEGHLRQLRQELAGPDYIPVVVAADNQVNPGISAVREFMALDDALQAPQRFFVHDSCKWLIQELGEYRWQSHATIEEEFIDKPVKRNDHSADALRYAVFTHFYKPHGRTRTDDGHLDDRLAG